MYMGLQVGRGIAALLVLLHHVSLGSEDFYGDKSFNGFFDFGFIGVDFFFVLSGFIIYWVHSADSSSFNNSLLYIKKRIVRIYPPFILVSLILLLTYIYIPSISASNRNIGIITSIFLIPTPPLEPALSVSWTLMHELLFYTVFLTLYVKQKLLPILLTCWFICIILIEFSNINGIIKAFFFNPHNIEFILGVIAALIIKNQKGHLSHLVIGIMMFCFYIYNYQVDIIKFSNLLYSKMYLGITFMLIVSGLCTIDKRMKFPNILLLLGTASYSIYLIHSPIISVLNRVAQKYSALENSINSNIIFIIISVLSLAGGLIYYLIWEKPILKFFKKKIILKNPKHMF